ncbi:hypothetical protein EVAR_82860_1 [Eumeta japonica]|uniref:Uncharacterized protein n=1 Tax=Eumeta variegata TaxID=151549 RepID=A0A4C1V2L6_EUMVA|nr:hypothetical protein EVAR_82860_1 [Eumeta japonica]
MDFSQDYIFQIIRLSRRRYGIVRKGTYSVIPARRISGDGPKADIGVCRQQIVHGALRLVPIKQLRPGAIPSAPAAARPATAPTVDNPEPSRGWDSFRVVKYHVKQVGKLVDYRPYTSRKRFRKLSSNLFIWMARWKQSLRSLPKSTYEKISSSSHVIVFTSYLIGWAKIQEVAVRHSAGVSAFGIPAGARRGHDTIPNFPLDAVSVSFMSFCKAEVRPESEHNFQTSTMKVAPNEEPFHGGRPKLWLDLVELDIALRTTERATLH